jgi:omega-6 fatty acid desaturase (delta-12 desaturase)
MSQDSAKLPPQAWRDLVARYQTPSIRRAVWQIVSTIVPLFTLLWLMHRSLAVGYWLVLLLAVPTAGLLLRTFIIMHDCGHGSFFRSRRWNDTVGFLTGLLTLTPYVQWRHDHAIHHATSGNLERRGFGDITTLTVEEYIGLSWWGRFRYRMYRNPLVMFGLGPIWFAIRNRWQTPGEFTQMKEIWNVHTTNVALAGLVGIGGLTVGIKPLVLIYVPVFLISGIVGIWLFYVQHQYDEAYWERPEKWDYTTAALAGSSYLKLPRVLQWLTGNIGLHHVHHLSPKIPNYFLQRCHDEIPVLQQAPVVTLWEGLLALRLKLWDEENRQLVSFRRLRERRAVAASTAPRPQPTA